MNILTPCVYILKLQAPNNNTIKDNHVTDDEIQRLIFYYTKNKVLQTNKQHVMDISGLPKTISIVEMYNGYTINII